VSRGKRRADRIRQDIPIVQVLYDLGYQIRLDGGDREQQFPCDLHGDGSDNKPSARVYPDSDSWYCFACGQSRDAISTIKERLDVGFSEACRTLEQKYGLPSLPWEDGDEAPTQNQNLPDNLKKPTFDQAKLRAYALLDSQKTDRILALPDCLTFWEAYDMILWRVEEAEEDESVALTSMVKLKEKILDRIKQRVKDGGVTEITGQR
jgi:DNA primase